MRPFLFMLLPFALPLTATAQSHPIDTSVLPSQTAFDVAKLTPLALTENGVPAMVLLDLDAGDVVPPHATETGLRLLTVLSGTLSWGDGETINPAEERIYPAGTVLAIPAGDPHWLAARSGDLRLQLVLLDDEVPVAGLAEQMR